MGELINAYKIVVGQLGEKRQLGRIKLKWSLTF
jgi:hypothetical protein